MKIIKPPNEISERDMDSTTIFLAGSIENGKATNWQALLEYSLNDYSDKELTIFNPRRDDWDIWAEQTIDNPYFYEQVNWEMDAMERANIVFMYFDPRTKAPISLLELGLHAKTSNIIVCCPDEFYRQGNVEIVCQRSHIPFFRHLSEAIEQIRTLIDLDLDLKNFCKIIKKQHEEADKRKPKRPDRRR